MASFYTRTSLWGIQATPGIFLYHQPSAFSLGCLVLSPKCMCVCVVGRRVSGHDNEAQLPLGSALGCG